MRTKTVSALVLVVVTASLPLAGMLTGNRSKVLPGENRLRAGAPRVSLRDPVRSFNDFKRFFNDNYGFRDQLVWVGGNIKVNLWGVSPRPRVYFVGRRGWLFYSATVGESTSTMDEYRGLMPLSKMHLTETIKSFEGLESIVEKNGGVLYAAFIPNKQTVYPEHLPEHFNSRQAIVENRQLNQLYNIMPGSSVSLINLESELLRSKNIYKGLLYNPRTDYSHWNMRGAYIAYKQVMDRIKQDFNNINVIGYGDLQFKTVKKLAKTDFPLFAGFFDWYGKELVPETVGFKKHVPKSGRKVLLLGDSFGRNIAPYFQETFENISFYRANHFSLELLEREKFEIVIWLRSARYIKPVEMQADSLTLPLAIDSYLEEVLENL